MIKAIIFDFHDTVIKDGFSSILKEDQVIKPENWKSFWRGEIPEDEFWKRVAADIGEDETWIETSKASYYSTSIPVEGILPIVEKLKGKYKLGLLANTPKPWFDDAVSRFNLEEFFDVLVSSGGSGLLKPDKEIYLLICEKLGLSPRECLYIDDSEVKLNAAKDLGMEGILFKNSKQLTDELKKKDLL